MSERSLLPQGTYNAVAVLITTEQGEETYAQFGKSKERGTPQVVLNFEITDGPYVGRRVAWIGYFTDKTAERTIQSLRYCGLKGDDLMMAVVQPLNNPVEIVVEHNEYEGKVSERVAWVNRPGGGGLRLKEPMNANDLRSFAAQMRSKVKSIAEVEAPKKANTPAPSPSADLADDLNF